MNSGHQIVRIQHCGAWGAFAFFEGGFNMMKTQTTSFKLVFALGLALSLAACSKKNASLETGGIGNGSDVAARNGSDGLSGSEALVPGSVKEFQTAVGDRVFFENDQSTLTAEGREILMKQANWLQQYPDVQIQIEGHADERGTREYNISLSARRATAVRSFLISQGISENRVATIAYGKERPAKLCDAEECWSQNRRAVTVITDGARTS
jgi:peptidoglycan-associated lipoprotein